MKSRKIFPCYFSYVCLSPYITGNSTVVERILVIFEIWKLKYLSAIFQFGSNADKGKGNLTWERARIFGRILSVIRWIFIAEKNVSYRSFTEKLDKIFYFQYTCIVSLALFEMPLIRTPFLLFFQWQNRKKIVLINLVNFVLIKLNMSFTPEGCD
jgi:hypothetical protein